MSLLEFEIQNIIKGAVDFLMLDATLHHKGEATYDDDGYLTSPEPPIAVRGFVDEYSDLDRAAGIPQEYRKITILGGGLNVTPTAEDKITIQGKTYTIHTVDRDPATATWTFGAS